MTQLILKIILTLIQFYLTFMVLTGSLLRLKPDLFKEPQKFIKGYWKRLFCLVVVILLNGESIRCYLIELI